MNHLNVKIPLLSDRFHLFWPYTKKEADEWLKRRKYDHEACADGTAMGFCCYSNRKGNGAAIFLRRWSGSIEDIGVLVHEAIHAATFIRANLGVDETNESSEVLCYLSDFITQKSLRKLGLPK